MEFGVEKFVGGVEDEVVQVVGDGHDHGGGHGPPEAPGHYARECLLEDFFAPVLSSNHLCVLRHYFAHHFKFALVVLPVLLYLVHKQHVFQLLQIFVTPKAWQICRLSYFKVREPKRIFTFTHFTCKKEYQSHVLCIFMIFE